MSKTMKDVAQWMLNEINKHDYLYQEETVYNILETFGEKFVYQNKNGNLVIERKVLSAFRKLTNESVVWSRCERMWRLRDNHDESGRQQD